MKSKILVALLCVVSFFAGSIWGKFNFVTSEIYSSSEDIEVKTDSGSIGKIPFGTELHFHSSAHSATKYFLFIEVPIEESASKVKAAEFDSYGGIKPLTSTFKDGV
ncbi:hypothetical protein [Bowmanella denitrificans]|uniref:hypothetical protein n=1 Tax=Bowmanella denitrificans TaxID=366582 RepID=UPI0011AF3385|nr:hypothetical protein [Bowmanella denitrificans]